RSRRVDRAAPFVSYRNTNPLHEITKYETTKPCLSTPTTTKSFSCFRFSCFRVVRGSMRSLVRSRALQLPEQPRAGEREMTFDGRRRDAEKRRGLLDGEAAEVAKLHDLGFFRRNALERVERVAEREEIEPHVDRPLERGGQLRGRDAGIPFSGVATAC